MIYVAGLTKAKPGHVDEWTHPIFSHDLHVLAIGLVDEEVYVKFKDLTRSLRVFG